MDETREETQEARIEKKINLEVAGAVALAAHPSGAMTIAPKNMNELFEFAKMMAISGICVRPQFRGNPGACLSIALQAFSWGFSPFSVANKAYVVKNKAGEETIAFEAQLVHAVVNNSAQLKGRLRATYTGEGIKRACKITGYLKGDDEPFEYQSPRVDQIAVKNSPLWQSDSDQQLWYYSVRAWARRHVPEILLGVSTPEEARGEIIDAVATELPERPKREDYVTDESAKSYKPPSEPEPEPVDEPGDELAEEPFLVVDAHGEEHQVDGAANAAEGFRAALEEAGRIRQDLGVAAVWESNASMLYELRERGYDNLADELGQFYSEALAQADAAPAAKSAPPPTTAPPPKKAAQRPPQRPAGQAAAKPGVVSPGPSDTGEQPPEAQPGVIVAIKPRALGGARSSGWDWPGFVDDVLAQARQYPPSRTAEVRAKNRSMIDALHDFSQKMRTTDFARLEQGLAAIQHEVTRGP